MNSSQPISVIVIEDEKEVRDGLSFILDHTDGFRCAGAYRSYDEALHTVTSPPDVLLSDIGLPGISGIEGARLFKEKFPTTAIIMLTVYSDDEKIFQSICVGASGYVLKKAPPARILEAIRDVRQGGASMSAEIALRVMNAFRVIAPQVRSERTHQTRGGNSQ